MIWNLKPGCAISNWIGIDPRAHYCIGTSPNVGLLFELIDIDAVWHPSRLTHWFWMSTLLVVCSLRWYCFLGGGFGILLLSFLPQNLAGKDGGGLPPLLWWHYPCVCVRVCGCAEYCCCCVWWWCTPMAVHACVLCRRHPNGACLEHSSSQWNPSNLTVQYKISGASVYNRDRHTHPRRPGKLKCNRSPVLTFAQALKLSQLCISISLTISKCALLKSSRWRVTPQVFKTADFSEKCQTILNDTVIPLLAWLAYLSDEVKWKIRSRVCLACKFYLSRWRGAKSRVQMTRVTLATLWSR